MSVSRRDLLKIGLASGGMLLAPTGGDKDQALADISTGDVLTEPLAAQTKSLGSIAKTSEDTCNTVLNAPEPNPAWAGDYQTLLHVPPRLYPKVVGNHGDVTVNYYEIEMEQVLQPIGNSQVEIWGYKGVQPDSIETARGTFSPARITDASMPGAIIIQEKDVESVIRFKNNLGNGCEEGKYNYYDPSTLEYGDPVLDGNGQPTTRFNTPDPAINAVIHLHGMASLPQYDGYADDFIPPGYGKDYHYPNDRAATVWYHDHTAGRTQRNVGMGLAGMYIVVGPEEEYVNQVLPSDYGVDDIPLIIQTNPLFVNIDAQCRWNGSDIRSSSFDALDEQCSTNFGETGFSFPGWYIENPWYTDPTNTDKPTKVALKDKLVVNGQLKPKLEVGPGLYRFRMLNATDVNGLIFYLTDSLADNAPPLAGFSGFTIIGTDGGLMKKPVRGVCEFPISMGERYEVIIDFAELHTLRLATDLERIFLKCSNMDQFGAFNPGVTWALMEFVINPNISANNNPIPDYLLDPEFRKFPNPDCASRTVDLTFRQDGAIDGGGMLTVYPGCKKSAPPEGPLTPSSKFTAFTIGGFDPSNSEGISWMEGEPIDPFPDKGNAPPQGPGTPPVLPNVEHRIIPNPALQETQIWRLINESVLFHPVHIHLLDTLMLERSKRLTEPNSVTKIQDPPVDGELPDLKEITIGEIEALYPDIESGSLIGLDLIDLRTKLKEKIPTDSYPQPDESTIKVDNAKMIFDNLEIHTLPLSDPEAPQRWERNWKDVYFLSPGEEIKIIGTFGPHEGRYMMHCHNLNHEDCDMMIEFEVGDSGYSPMADPARPIGDLGTLGEQGSIYNLDSVLEFNEAVYGLSIQADDKHFSRKTQKKIEQHKAKILKKAKAIGSDEAAALLRENGALFGLSVPGSGYNVSLPEIPGLERDPNCETNNPWAYLGIDDPWADES